MKKLLLLALLCTANLSAIEYDVEFGYVIIHRHVDENGEEIKE